MTQTTSQEVVSIKENLMSRKLTQEEFIKRSESVHNNIYNYSSSKYLGRTVLVDITCTKHSFKFQQAAGLHMSGQTSCTKCISEKKLLSRVCKRRSKTPVGYKICGKCNTSTSLTEFIPNKLGADGYYSVCRKCCAKRSKLKRQDPAFRAEVKKISQAYTKRTRDRANVKSAKRRAARIQATPIWAEDEFEILFIQEAYHLAVLRGKLTGFNWEVDHQVPLNSTFCCGLHCMSNLAVIPEVTNRSKGNSHWPDMW